MDRLIALVALALLVAAMPVAGADPLAQIARRLEAHDTGRADFVQTRTIAELERPQVARGRLVWSPGGVIWQVDQPFRTVYVMRDESTVEISADGTRTERSTQDEPVAGRVVRILRALFRGDARMLEGLFKADATLRQDRWTVTLVPRRSPMSIYLKSIQVSGTNFVEAVRIDDTNGGVTLLQFRNHSLGDLSEEERRLRDGR